MKATTLVMSLVTLACLGAAAQAPTTPPLAQEKSSYEQAAQLQAGQLEEIAMCHHAIKAARHDGLAFGQNPYYRYILNSPQTGSRSNVYPIPQRCKNMQTAWILNYAKMGADVKAIEDKTMRDEVGMTISDAATDAQFLTIVINKMELEGDKAVFWDNRDKDLP
jgi:curli biogenesis system outer membrane secretion channel CsgG